MIMPYNGEIFDLRRQYDKVFPELSANHEEELALRDDEDTRFFKIKYTLNVLPQMDKLDFDGNLMDLFGDTDQIDMFQTQVVQDLIEFKWERYGRIIHKSAASVHIVYVVTFLLYLD